MAEQPRPLPKFKEAAKLPSTERQLFMGTGLLVLGFIALGVVCYILFKYVLGGSAPGPTPP